MMTHDIATREGLPPEMQTLLRILPRDGWQDHPGLKRATRQWMGAHQGFRLTARALRRDAEAFLDGGLDGADYADRLGRAGDVLVRHLHGHHAWEDRRFFPELAAADRRFAPGLELLETDHIALDALLDRFTRTANRVIALETLEPAAMRDAAGPVLEDAGRLEGFLARHLTDEEDLVVPIVLHHRLRG